jgi:hypothetical protein
MHRPTGLIILIASALLAGFHDAKAQGEDALPLRGGTLRINLIPDWAHWNERFGRGTPGYSDGTREPLAVDFNSDSLGVAGIPSLASAQARLQSVTGLTGFQLNLGRAQLTIENSFRVVPVGIDLALSSRLVLRASVPIVRARVTTFLGGSDTLNPATLGTVGLNPALSDGTTYAAYVTQVDTLLRALLQQSQSGPAGLRSSAAAEYATLLDFLCRLSTLAAGQPAGAHCANALIVNPAQSPVLPVATSEAGDSIAARLGAARTRYDNLRAQYASQGVTLPAFDAAYALPAAALDSSGLRSTLLGGFGGDSLTSIVRTRLGNVELGGWYQLAMGPRWRSQVAVTLRLPTAVEDSPHNFVDLATGVDAPGYEIAMRNDFVLRSDFWLHAGGRIGGWSSSTLLRRVGPANAFLVPISDTAQVNRSPGGYLAIDVVPNWQLDDAFRLGVGLHWFRQAAASYSYVDPTDEARIGLAASVLDEETAISALQLGAGVTFSTLPRYAAGQASLPYTVTAAFHRTYWGSGGKVPAAASFSLAIRAYLSLW